MEKKKKPPFHLTAHGKSLI